MTDLRKIAHALAGDVVGDQGVDRFFGLAHVLLEWQRGKIEDDGIKPGPGRYRAGNSEWRRPHLFRLTYRYVGHAQPTDESSGNRTTNTTVPVVETALLAIVRKPPLHL